MRYQMETIVILMMIVMLSFATVSIATPPATVWQATFHDVVPNRAAVTQAYCQSHSPDQFTTTVTAILAQGSKAKNGVLVKYKNYNQSEKQGLYFIDVDAVFSGVEQGKPWELATYLHEQKLSDLGVTDVVWSNADCKGKFTGRAISH